MIEPGILFFVNAFVFDRGLHGYRGCDEQKETKETKTLNAEHRTPKADFISLMLMLMPELLARRGR